MINEKIKAEQRKGKLKTSSKDVNSPKEKKLLKSNKKEYE